MDESRLPTGDHARGVYICIWSSLSQSFMKQMIASWSMHDGTRADGRRSRREASAQRLNEKVYNTKLITWAASFNDELDLPERGIPVHGELLALPGRVPDGKLQRAGRIIQNDLAAALERLINAVVDVHDGHGKQHLLEVVW